MKILQLWPELFHAEGQYEAYIHFPSFADTPMNRQSAASQSIKNKK